MEAKERKRGRPTGTGAPESEVVRQVREKLGLSQEKFAQDLQVTSSAVYKMEAEKRLPGRSKVLERLKDAAKRAGIEIELDSFESHK
jgi:DNA-binding XRE family transcriptional regulator